MASSSPNKRIRKTINEKGKQDELITFMISSQRLSISYIQTTDINLSHLQLLTIERFPFEHLPHLLSLDLSHNQLTTINDWSQANRSLLQRLNVSRNQLQTLLFLKNFKHLIHVNVSDNRLKDNERFLSLYLCSTIEELIDGNRNQIEDDQIKIDQWLALMETKIDRLWTMSYDDKYRQESTIDRNSQIVKNLLDDFRHGMVKIFEKQQYFCNIRSSPLANYLMEEKIEKLCSSPTTTTAAAKRTLKTHLTADFETIIDMNSSNVKGNFEPIKFLRCHHPSSVNDDSTTSVRMCAFEPNATGNILATCGGHKVCLIDCDSCDVTHVFEVVSLRSSSAPIDSRAKKTKEKSGTVPMSIEQFSCLCWIELENGNETLKILAVGATNGHIYLLSPKWKLMFGEIELPASSISCLTWHPTDPLTLVIGSYHTIRFVDIRSHIDRLRSFIRKRSKPAAQFDYDDSTVFINKVTTTRVCHFDGAQNSIIIITDLLFFPISNENIVLLVGTTSGIFAIRNQDSPIQLTFPKSMWTVGEHVESLRLIDHHTRLVAVNLLGLDQICCFDVEQSLVDQQINIVLTLSNSYRQISTKMAVFARKDENDNSIMAFECIVGSDHGSFVHHQARSNTTTITKKNNKKNSEVKPYFESKWFETPWSLSSKISTPPNILSASLNEHFLGLTTSNNLVCIYKRK